MFGLITWVNTKTWLSLLVIIIWPTKSNYLTYPPHKASPLQPNRTLAEYVDVYSPLFYTPNPRHPQVVCIATTSQEKMKPWKETSRSSKITTSSRRGLAATPSRLPVKAACIYVSFPHFDYCKDYVDVSDIWCNRLLFPFYVIIWALCDDVQLCNCCVRELLILARAWFAFDLPSKTGCDSHPTNQSL
jgi:hypothetical protein